MSLPPTTRSGYTGVPGPSPIFGPSGSVVPPVLPKIVLADGVEFKYGMTVYYYCVYKNEITSTWTQGVLSNQIAKTMSGKHKLKLIGSGSSMVSILLEHSYSTMEGAIMGRLADDGRNMAIRIEKLVSQAQSSHLIKGTSIPLALKNIAGNILSAAENIAKRLSDTEKDILVWQHDYNQTMQAVPVQKLQVTIPIPVQKPSNAVPLQKITVGVQIPSFPNPEQFVCPECQNTGKVTLFTTIDKCRNPKCVHSQA